MFPPVIGGLLLLLRARHTLDDDAQAIITAIVEETQMLEAERDRLDLEAAHEAGDPGAATTDPEHVEDPAVEAVLDDRSGELDRT